MIPALPAASLAALLLAAAPASAASLLEATDGVLGRAEVEGSSRSEARARLAVDRGDWALAASAWDEARHAGADELLAGSWEVVSLAQAEQWELARLAALATLSRDPSDPRRHLVYAWLMCEGGAASATRKVVARLPDSGDIGLAGAILQLRSWRHQGRDRRVRRVRRRVLDQLPADAWLWLESSRGHFAAYQPEALDDLDRALRAPAASGVHVAAVLELRLALGDDEESVRVGLSGMERFPDHAGVATLTSVAASRPDGAAALRRILAAEPDRAVAHEVRGALALASDEPKTALQALILAGHGGRDTAAVVGMLGRSLVALGKPGEAHAALLGGMERHPLHLQLAAARFDAARRLADPALILAAADAWLVAAAAVAEPLPDDIAGQALSAALEVDRPSAALAWSDWILAAEVDHPGALRARAQALHRLERGQEALLAYEAALAAAPSDHALLADFATFLLQPSGGVEADPERARELSDRATLP